MAPGSSSNRASGTRSSGERSSGGHGRSSPRAAGPSGPGEGSRSPDAGGAGGGEASRRHSQEIVAAATRYFEAHYGEPIAPGDVARHLGISESCLDSCFDLCRRRTPVEALESFRLGQLFQRVREHPTDSLATQVRQCGLPALARTDRLFEASFGIGLAPFRHTSRRAAEDRAFRLAHPGPDNLVMHQDGSGAAAAQAARACQAGSRAPGTRRGR